MQIEYNTLHLGNVEVRINRIYKLDTIKSYNDIIELSNKDNTSIIKISPPLYYSFSDKGILKDFGFKIGDEVHFIRDSSNTKGIIEDIYLSNLGKYSVVVAKVNDKIVLINQIKKWIETSDNKSELING